jgi:hypothetical protein
VAELTHKARLIAETVGETEEPDQHETITKALTGAVIAALRGDLTTVGHELGTALNIMEGN